MTNPTAPPNSSAPTTAQVVGGTYNENTPVLIDGQAAPFQFDVNGNLKTTSSGGSSNNVNITDISGNPPALGNPLPVELSDGTNALGVVGNPLSVTGTVAASNPSVGTTGAVAPTSATEIGLIDGSGHLQGVSSANPLPVSVTAIVADEVNQGSPNTAANAWPVEVTDGTNVLGTPTHPVRIDPTGTTTQPVSGTVAVSNFPVTQPTEDLADGLIGNPSPVYGTQFGGTDGINLRAAYLDSQGRQRTVVENSDQEPAFTGSQAVAFQQNEGPAEQLTYDTNMSTVLGTQYLLGPNQRLKVDPLPTDVTFNGFLNTTRNLQYYVNCAGYATATIQIGGTWSGTITFNTTAGGSAANGQDPVETSAVLPVSGGNAITTTTGNGIWRISTTGLSRVGVAFTTATSGAPQITIVLSQNALAVSVLSVQQNSAGNLLTKSDIVGNAGAVLDAVITAATAPANALATLGVNNTTAPSLTTGQSVALQADYVGSLFIKPCRRSQTVAQATTIASTAAATTVLAAQASGVFADISTLIITPTAQGTGVAFTATLSDGTNNYIFDMNTGSTTSLVIQPPFVTNNSIPIPATTAQTAWTLALSSSAVTVHVTVVAVLQKAS